MSGLRCPRGREKLTAEQGLDKLSDKDAATRRKAAKALAKVFRENIRLFALITNTLAKDKEIEDRWRKYPTPEEIGSAPCRERVCQYVWISAVAASLKKKLVSETRTEAPVETATTKSEKQQ